jgi:SAM-dependent methyltransferase
VLVPTETEAQEVLRRHRRVWEQKPVLRRIYNEEFFSRLLSARTSGGVSVEVGGGPGFFKQLLPSVISTDLVSCPWLDVVADAQALPFQTSSVTNIFGLDVLHHLAAPMKLLKEAERILIPGGRLVLVEPWLTPFSRFLYRYFHQEDCDLSAQPWRLDDAREAPRKKAFDGNQAIPYLLFSSQNRQKTLAMLPHLACVASEPFCLFAYLLTFGFKPMNLLPEIFYPTVSMLERYSLPLWRRFAALRVLLVLEKTGIGVEEVRPIAKRDSGGTTVSRR